MKLRLSKLALDDIKSIHAFTVEHWGEEQAHRYVARLWDAFERIVAAPERWRRRDDIYPDCRIFCAGRPAILYRIRSGRVEIGRVLHTAMDFSRHLPPGFIEPE